jgi:hypothetical protein
LRKPTPLYGGTSQGSQSPQGPQPPQGSQPPQGPQTPQGPQPLRACVVRACFVRACFVRACVVRACFAFPHTPLPWRGRGIHTNSNEVCVNDTQTPLERGNEVSPRRGPARFPTRFHHAYRGFASSVGTQASPHPSPVERKRIHPISRGA